jgi:LPXTG-motif cell wall-anchored protein
MQFKRFLILILIFSFSLAWLPLNAQAAPHKAAGPNLLKNADFESSFAQINPDAQVAANWSAWWTPHPDSAPEWAYLQPNFGPSAGTCTTTCAHRIHGGGNAQRMFRLFAAYEGGLYQQVAVPLNADVRFSIYTQGWSSEQNDPVNTSISGTDMRMKIGIDPTGGTNPYSPNIVWSEPRNVLDSWYQFVLYARSQNTTITVFTYAAPFGSRRNNDVYWDDASLNVLSGDLAATAQASYPTATPAPIVYTPTPVSVALGANLLADGDFEGKLYIPCSNSNDVPWHHISCNGLDFDLRDEKDKRVYVIWNTVQVPIGWKGWWLPPNTKHGTDPIFYQNHPNNCYSDAPEGCIAWHNPEFRDTKGIISGPTRIQAGLNSQKYFTFYSVHEAGVMQTVNVPVGSVLRFGAYMQAWSSNQDGNELDPKSYLSSGQTSMHMKVGIDPTGGDDPWSSNIIWSPEHDAYDAYDYYEVRATAQSDHITVFTHSMPEKGLKHNDVYVDAAELVAIEVPAGATIPQPSSPNASAPAPAGVSNFVPGPTATPHPDGALVHLVKPGDSLFGLSLQYNVPMDQILQLNGLTKDSFIVIGRELVIAAPSATAITEPTLAPTPTPTPEKVAAAPEATQLCVRAFNDVDANSVYTSSEPLLNGALFTLFDAQGQQLTTYSSDGISEPHCFNKLAPGNYSITVQPPSGLVATSDRRWSVVLDSGATVNVNFGSHKVEATPQPEQSTGAAGSIGLMVIGILVGIGGLYFYQRRKAIG